MFKRLKNENDLFDLMQKTAWTLVRSAHDRFPEIEGAVRLQWCMAQMQKRFSGSDSIEDFIRAAYTNFKIESGSMNRF